MKFRHFGRPRVTVICTYVTAADLSTISWTKVINNHVENKSFSKIFK